MQLHMTSPTQLSLDCKPNIGSLVLKSHATEETEKLQELVAHLEEEKLKIDGLKRELPLCMQLLTNAMETSRQELQSLEELISLKSSTSSSDISADKASWMTSARLWNDEEFEVTQVNQQSQRLNGKGSIPSPELSLASSYKREIEGSRREESAAQKEKRKARRCWSPQLHRRFLNALHMLGGSQLATPKQITQLMKVDGLTNDEVKSHLQKYRLHTRIQTPRSPLVVVWVPPEYAHGGTPAAAFYEAHAATTRRVAPPSLDCNTNMFFH